MFSVVIPTMQKSPYLDALVESYCNHELVGEVLIVNNVDTPLPYSNPKVRVLQQAGNIYVNPSWNLGARESREELLVISNDDIWFDTRLIDVVARLLQLPVGIVGPSWQAMNSRRSRVPFFLPVYRLPAGFGTLMFLRKSNYVPIPEDLLINAGDNWLFDQQHRRNLQIWGISIGTEWSQTSSESRFSEQKRRDSQLYRTEYAGTGKNDRYRLEARLADVLKVNYRRVAGLLCGNSRSK